MSSFLDPETIIRTGGLIAIAVIVFAECGLLIGFFLPGDSLLFTAGVLAANQFVGLDIVTLCGVCGIAAVLGPLVGYWYGHAWGPRLFSREDSLFFRKQHLVRAHEFYERYGGRALVLARFIPIVRTFAPVVAGMASMDYRAFVIYTALGAAIWGVGVPLVGFFLGSAVPGIKDNLEIAIAVIVFISILPPIIHFLRERAKAKAASNARLTQS